MRRAESARRRDPAHPGPCVAPGERPVPGGEAPARAAGLLSGMIVITECSLNAPRRGLKESSQQPVTPAWRDAPTIDRLPGSRRTRMLRGHMAIQEVGSSTDLPHRAARRRCRLLFLVPVLLAFAGCMVGGCMVGPNYQRPKVSVSPSW